MVDTRPVRMQEPDILWLRQAFAKYGKDSEALAKLIKEYREMKGEKPKIWW